MLNKIHYVSPKQINTRICYSTLKISVTNSPNHIHWHRLHNQAAFWRYLCSLCYRPMTVHFLYLFLKAGDQHPGAESGDRRFSIHINKNIAISVNNNYSSTLRSCNVLVLIKKQCKLLLMDAPVIKVVWMPPSSLSQP